MNESEKCESVKSGGASHSLQLVVTHVAPPHVVLGGQVVRAHRAAAAVRVQLGRHLLGLQLVQQGREDAPGSLQLVVADEQTLVAVDHVQQQALVRVGQLLLLVRGLVLQVQLGGVQPQPQPRHLIVDLEVDGLLGLDAHDQLIGGHVHVGPKLVLVDVAGHVAELHADLRAARVQRLAGLEEEGHAVPARVVDVQRARRVRGRQRALGHRLVVQVAGQLGAVLLGAAAVLPQHRVLHLNHLHGAQHLDLLVADVLRVQRHGRLHGKQRHNLQQVVLDDVADDAVLVKVAATPLGAKVLTENDLHVADVLARPQRLKHEVGEAQHRQVLDQLLAQVVVDAVDLLLLEVPRQAAPQLRA
mmetsp:Transcript_8867/g.21925  ORF Transcript_8867/g.21925 Transcript_8867/m.21925 type:complete len:358 (-) Transcript_8867:2504-3577(-)